MEDRRATVTDALQGRRHRDTRCLGAKAQSAGPARHKGGVVVEKATGKSVSSPEESEEEEEEESSE